MAAQTPPRWPEVLCTLLALPDGDSGVCHIGRDIARIVECGSDGSLDYARRQVTLTLHFRPGIFASPITMQVYQRRLESRRLPPLPLAGDNRQLQWTWYIEPSRLATDGFEGCTETRNPLWH